MTEYVKLNDTICVCISNADDSGGAVGKVLFKNFWNLVVSVAGWKYNTVALMPPPRRLALAYVCTMQSTGHLRLRQLVIASYTFD
jgi:hypothetical protein